MQRDGRRFTVEVAADGEGLVSHAGAALLAEAADRVGPDRGVVGRVWPECASDAAGTIPAGWSATWR